jgi:hypothetical protein
VNQNCPSFGGTSGERSEGPGDKALGDMHGEEEKS